MKSTVRSAERVSHLVAFYHDIEQDIDSAASPEQCRRVVKEFLRLEKQYGVRATYNVVGRLFREQPDLIDWILQEGHEVAFHSFHHQSDWRPDYFIKEIDLCREYSPIPSGYRSPQSKIDQRGIEHLWEKGFLWNAEGDSFREPYFIYKGLVRIPISLDDWPLHTGETTVEGFIRQYSELLQKRVFLAVGFHDSVTSFAPEERLNAWERILKAAIDQKSLPVTFSEAADLFRRAAVSRYYSQIAKDWNQNTRVLYRTKRFQELIREEAGKLPSPVVVDLGSGGGVLSAPLKDVAKKVYCVDNSAGMVSDVDFSSCIEARLGEVTDSGLPDRSADMVICARVIEYLFWPDRLADEIKRIGKPGATFLVTFPADRGQTPANEGAPPDRIRRNFKADDIVEWAKQIGTGRLFGVQYETVEPAGLEAEDHYRMTEEHPPANILPTNWAYIGKVERTVASSALNRTIPLSCAPFQFPEVPQGRRGKALDNTLRRMVRPFWALLRKALPH